MAEHAVDVVDREALVSTLTVGQLMELVQFDSRRLKLDAEIAKQKQLVAEYEQAREASVSVFKDTEKLAAVSAPFRVKTLEDADKVCETLRKHVSCGGVALLAMAVEL